MPRLKEFLSASAARPVTTTLLAAAVAYQIAVFVALIQDVRFGNPILDSRFQIEWAFDLARGAGNDRLFFQSPLYAYGNALLLRIFGWKPVLIGVLQLGMVLATAGCVALAAWSFGVRRRLIVGVTVLALFWPLFPYYAADLNKTALEILLHGLILALASLVLTARGVGEPLASTLPSARRTWLPVSGRGEWIAWALLGLSIGLGALVRASLLLVPLVLIPFVADRRSLRLALLCVGFLPPVAWAVAHNSMVAGQLLPVQTSGGYNLFLGNNRHNPSGTQQAVPGTTLIPFLEEPTANETATQAAGRTLSVREVNAYYTDRVLEFLRRDPDWFGRILFEKLRRYGHRTELPDNECYPCARSDLWLLRLNPLGFDWLVWLALPALLGITLWGRVGPDAGGSAVRGNRARFFPAAYSFFLALTVIAFFLNSRVRVGHVAVWLVVLAQGSEALLRARERGLLRGRALLLTLAAGLPGLWWVSQGPLEESYHPDNFTAKKAVVEAELGLRENARDTLHSVEDLEVRLQLGEYLTRLEAGQEPPLLSPLIPKRRPK